MKHTLVILKLLLVLK